MSDRREVKTDILIVGGGSAGCLAAIRAREVAPDLDVTILEKGDLRRGGTLAMGMDALNVVVVPGVTSEDDYLSAVATLSEGIFDPAPHRVVARRSYPLVQKLESWGVQFGLAADGSYLLHQIHPNAPFTVPMRAPDLKPLLAQKVSESGARVLTRAMALALLTDEGGVVGAVALDLRTGGLFVCSARAVILAGGGAARFGLPNTGYLFGTLDFPGNAGDGYALAYRAGADLTNMEYTSNHAITKDSGLPITSTAIPLGGILRDSRGEPVLPVGTSPGSYFQQSARAFREYADRGPLFLSVRHLPEERIKEIEAILFSTERPAQRRFLAQRGIDLRERDVELGPTEYKLCSGHGMAGVVVDERATTSLPGLYAAGDAAAVPFQYLTGAFVMGEVAAEEAAAWARRAPARPVEELQVERIAEPLGATLARGPRAEVSLHEFEYKVRRVVNEYVAPPKNEWKLRNALAWVSRFRAELGAIVRVADPHELGRWCELGFILDCAELSATASLARTESRWGPKHWRSDYPRRDDANWLRHVILRRADDGSPSIGHVAAGRPLLGGGG